MIYYPKTVFFGDLSKQYLQYKLIPWKTFTDEQMNEIDINHFEVILQHLGSVGVIQCL